MSDNDAENRDPNEEEKEPEKPKYENLTQENLEKIDQVFAFYDK